MRLRKHAAALALAALLATALAPGLVPAAAFGQAAAPRAVQVTPSQQDANAPRGAPARAPDAPPTSPDEQQRAIELYRAHFGGQLTKAPYLGVSTSTVPAALRQHLGLPEGVGLVVEFVEPDSPAQAAGLKQYDIIKKLDEQILVNAQQLAVLVRSRKAGDEIKLAVIRGAKDQTLSAKLVEKEVKELGDIFQDWAVPGQVQPNDLDVLKRMQDRRQREARPARGGAAGHTVNQAGTHGTMSVWRDNDMMLELSKNSNAPGRRLVVTDKSGKVLHDINLDDANERTKLPPKVVEKLKQMEGKLPPGSEANYQHKVETNRNNKDNKNPNKTENQNDNDNDKDDADDKDESDDEDDVEVDVDVDFNRAPSARGPIGPNDLLRIAVADIHGPGVETVKTTRVRDGRVRLPHVEPIVCQGLTAVELEKQIVKAYTQAKIAANVNVRVEKIAGENDAPRKH